MIRKGLLLSLAPLAVMFGLGAWGFLTVDPAGQFPVHWGLDGRPDRFAGPFEAFFVLPLVAAGVVAFLAVIPRLDPRGDNLRKSAPFYLTTWIATLVFLAVLQAVMTFTATGVVEMDSALMPRLVACGVSLLLLVMGNVLGKARPNWFAGVRTPWTLSSDLAWDKTHRLAGRMFVAVGLVGAVAAWLLPPAWMLPLLLVGNLAVAAVAVLYSWLVWKTAPDRRTGAQAVDG
jgi:uncharacterized membrane protein